jgi:hypothetical protein
VKGKVFFLLMALLFVASLGFTQNMGIFDSAQDIGEVSMAGEVFYDPDTGLYELSAAGETIGDTVPTDEFFFVYREIEGNFAIEANVFAYQEGRVGLMIRDSLDPGSVHASLLGEQSLTLYPTFRTVPNGPTSSADGEVTGTDGSIRLVKIGNSVQLYYRDAEGAWTLLQTEIIPFEGSVYAGLAATTENDNAYGFFDVDSVQLEMLPVNVTRTITEGADNLVVTLTASAVQVSSVTVSEVIPSKTVAASVQASQGMVQDVGGTQQWVLDAFSGEATLTYTITPPDSRNLVWTGTFTDGTNSGYIAGQMMFPEEAALVPRGTITVHPEIPTFIEAEWGTVEGEDNLWGLFFSPMASNGVAIQAINGTPTDMEQGIIRYSLNVQEAGEYYLFFNARAEQDQSDSVYIGFDQVEATDEYGYAVPNAKQFQRRWFQTYAEGGRFWETTGIQRPIQLSAGAHDFIIVTREKASKIDWFVITPSPNINIAAFVPEVQTFAIVRDLPEATNGLPSPVSVTLNLSVIAGETPDIRVEESAPEGWTVQNVVASAGTAEPQGSTIIWTYPGAAADATLTYDAVPEPGTAFGIFNGIAWDQKNLLEKSVAGDVFIPEVIDFQPYPEPIAVGAETVFMQAERAHSHGGDVIIRPDTGLVSDLYVEMPTDGRSGGQLTGSQIVFNLDVQQTGTYYVFMNAKGESAQEDSFLIGFDQVTNDGNLYGVSVPHGNFERVWIYVISGPDFWNVTDEPRPYELTAGAHTLIVHSREPRAKIDWIALTTDPALDLETLLEPGQDTSVSDFMMY